MRRSLLLLVPAAFLVVAACSDDDTTTPNNGNDTPMADAGQDASSHEGHDAGQQTADAGDAGLPALKCTDAELAANAVTDGGTVEITFPTASAPAQYTNHCVTIKAGSSVTFTGSFLNHPLEPAGGDEPNPITKTDADQPDNKLVVTFPNAGSFGYRCEFHPTSMYGAIRVVP